MISNRFRATIGLLVLVVDSILIGGCGGVSDAPVKVEFPPGTTPPPADKSPQPKKQGNVSLPTDV